MLVDRKVPLSKNHQNATCLHRAAFQGDTDVCMLLVSIEPKMVFERDLYGETASDIAKGEECKKYLLGQELRYI